MSGCWRADRRAAGVLQGARGSLEVLRQPPGRRWICARGCERRGGGVTGGAGGVGGRQGGGDAPDDRRARRDWAGRAPSRAREAALYERRAAAFDLERCVVCTAPVTRPHVMQVIRARGRGVWASCSSIPTGSSPRPAYDLGVVPARWCDEVLRGRAGGYVRGYCSCARDAASTTRRYGSGFAERVSSACLARLGLDALGGDSSRRLRGWC